MSKFKVGDEVIAYGKSYGIIKDLGDIGCLITFKDKTHHVQYPDIKKSPHQELLDLGWELAADNDQEITYQLFDDPFTYQLKIDRIRKTIDNRYCVFGEYTNITMINLQLVKILTRLLEELE